jgi:hypothetical protein
MKIITVKKCDGGIFKQVEFDNGKTLLLSLEDFSNFVMFVREDFCCENCRNFIMMKEGKISYCQLLGTENCFKFFEC